MQTVFKQLAILYVFLLAGWLIGKFKKEKAPHADILSVLLVNFLLPCKIFSNISVDAYHLTIICYFGNDLYEFFI